MGNLFKSYTREFSGGGLTTFGLDGRDKRSARASGCMHAKCGPSTKYIQSRT